MTFSLFDFIPLSGALVALLILVSMLLKSKSVTLTDYVLLAFLCVCLLSLLLSVLDQTGYIVNVAHLLRLNHIFGLLRPPLFFLYIYFAIHPAPKRSLWNGLHFIPVLILTLYLGPYFILPSETKLELYYSPTIQYSIVQIPSWYFYFGLFYSVFYFLASAYVFKKSLKNKGYLKREVKLWILWLLIAYAAFIGGAMVRIAFHLGNEWNYLVYYILTFALIVACLILLTSRINPTIGVYRNKYVNLISGETKLEVLEKLIAVMKSEKLFLSDRLRLKDVAERINMQEYLLSQIINEGTGKTFIEFTNQFRIEEAKGLLAGSSASHLTIEAIASESGFNSKASFYSAFKKNTGLTPREFRQKVSR